MDFTWERAAAMGEPMPEGLPLSEQKAYEATALLYARFNLGAITRENAAPEKAKIKLQLQSEIDAENVQDNLAYQRGLILRGTEMAKIAARKNPCKETCLSLCDTLDAILKDERFTNVKYTEHGANCPVCNKFFNQDHAYRKPNFCEECGCKLGWSV